MSKLLSVFLLILLNSYAIQLDLKPDKKIEITSKDLRAIKQYFRKKYNFVIVSDKDARKIVKENRLLANVYLKSSYNKEDKEKLLIAIEDKLARMFIRRMQERIQISSDVIKSYYLDHKDEFKKPDRIKFIVYKFNTLKSAMDFFNKNKNRRNVLHSSFTNGKTQVADITSLPPIFQAVIEDGSEHYYTYPIPVSKGRYYILYIQRYLKGKGYEPLKKVQNRIKEFLYQRTFLREKEKVLKQYEAK